MKTFESIQTAIPPHCRAFALEIQQTDLMVKSKENRKTGIITPSGARISLLFFCGALTEINRGGKGSGYVRIADPTGVLVLYLKPRSPEVTDILDTLFTPVFVSVIASVESENCSGESGFRLILEMIRPSDRLSRDQWIVRTAYLTLKRLERLLSVISGEQGNDDEIKVITRYGTSNRQLHLLGSVSLKALGQVQVAGKGESEKAEVSKPTHGDGTAEIIMGLIRQHSGPRGVSIQELTGFAGKSGVEESLLIETIKELIIEDELYQPSSGFVKIL